MCKLMLIGKIRSAPRELELGKGWTSLVARPNLVGWLVSGGLVGAKMGDKLRHKQTQRRSFRLTCSLPGPLSCNLVGPKKRTAGEIRAKRLQCGGLMLASCVTGSASSNLCRPHVPHLESLRRHLVCVDDGNLSNALLQEALGY